MLGWLQNLDRRVIFLFLLLSVAFGLFVRINLPVAIEPSVRDAYDTLEALKPGDKVLMAFDYGPSTMAEIHPAALAMLRHCLKRSVRVVMFTIWNEGIPMIQDAVAKIPVPLGKTENVDYVNLGFKWAGLTGSGVIEGMGSDLKAVFPVSTSGVPYDQIPVLSGVKTLKDFKILISLSAGSPGIDEYITYANGRYNIPLIAAVTKVTAPRIFPYLNHRQLYGLTAGLVGGAEYEQLTREPGFGLAGMTALSVAQLVTLLLIVLANLIHFAGGRKT